MDAGLHVGLAAWVHARAGGGGFLACSELPVPLTLVDLASPSSMADLARAWEFALLTNGDVRRGQPARSAASHPSLWARHRELLARMEFATRSWTEQEEQQLQAARAVLFSDGPGGFPVPSPAFTLYQEYRSIYRTLEEQARAPDQLTTVLAEWLVVGHKTEVEAALSTLTRLTSRSSQPTAERQRTVLAEDLLPSTADGSYAATTFTPLSAVDPGTWLVGRTGLDDLEQALPTEVARASWDGWRANRTGHLDLRFVALTLHRSWFTAEQYAAQDWRLPGGATVSAGDGSTGEVPAYAVTAYLVEVTGTSLAGRTHLPPPPPDPVRPTRGGWRHAVEPHQADRGRQVVLLRPAAAVREPVRRQLLDARVELQPSFLLGVEPLEQPGIRRRLLLTTDLVGSVAGGPTSPPVPRPAGAFLVGLGCAVVPPSPNPSPTYTWAP